MHGTMNVKLHTIYSVAHHRALVTEVTKLLYWGVDLFCNILLHEVLKN